MKLDEEEAMLHLPLSIGDVVVVLEESQGWYLGKKTANPSMKGVFPKSFVRLGPETPPVLPPIVGQIESAIAEWQSLLHAHFVGHGENFESNVRFIQDVTKEVMNVRDLLVSNKLTSGEVRTHQQKAIKKMIFMNHHLGLDLVVRDAQGNVLSKDHHSAVVLYRNHVKSAMESEMVVHNPTAEDSATSNTFKISVRVKNFVSTKVTEDADMILSVYESAEGRSPKALFESFVVKGWRRNAADEIERRKNLKVIFGDLSKNDILNKRLFLICNFVTDGNYCKLLDNDKQGAERQARSQEINFKKPIGVAAAEITDMFTFFLGKSAQREKKRALTLPFLAGGDSDCAEALFKRLMFDKKHVDKSGEQLFLDIGVIFGGNSLKKSNCKVHQKMQDPNQVILAKKLGLPDVILPDDVRNDLYVTLVSGEFSRLDKRQDRNVEVTVEACDAGGNLLINEKGSKRVIGHGVGSDEEMYDHQYKSAVYYHKSDPRWNETFKVAVRADQFEGSHLRFLFRHRSRYDTKEKAFPYAMAFLKLVNEYDKTAIKDGLHELIVYKVDKKVTDLSQLTYVGLPHIKSSFTSKQSKTASALLTPLSKDVLTVQTTLASTKLTQNEGLLSLLKWKSEKERLGTNLSIFDQKVKGDELVIFIPDVLDALFTILMENPDSEQYDKKVFKSLIKCITLITDSPAYQHFVPVLELYIEGNFYATLAYNKLLLVLKDLADCATLEPKELSDSMKCLKYIFKFIVKSRTLYSDLNGGKDREDFEELLRAVLNSLVKVMFAKSEDLHSSQADCLRNMVQSIPDLSSVFDKQQLAEVIMQMIKSLPDGQLNEEKLNTIRSLVRSELFQDESCRLSLVPKISTELTYFLDGINRGTAAARVETLCVETVGDVLSKLFDIHKDNPESHDVLVVVLNCLKTMIQMMTPSKRRKQDVGGVAITSNLISLLSLMTPFHWTNFMDSFHLDSDENGRANLGYFIIEVLEIFRDIIVKSVFPKDWSTMIMLQNSVILRALCQFSHTISDYFRAANYDHAVWTEFFNCAITFMTQPSLQVEKFSENKRRGILKEYRDMRKEMGLEIRKMWFNLSLHKKDFIPSMIGPFLEMTLIPEAELRKSTIPIFFDMIQCEYYSDPTLFGEVNGDLEYPDANKRDSYHRVGKQNFNVFKNELILRLDSFIGDHCRGDDYFKHLFTQIMMEHCEGHTTLRICGVEFVKVTSKLMVLLLEYQSIMQNESDKENQMCCIANLLEFYQSIGKEELYVKYLKKLTNLHEQCGNWTEAGHTIMQYAKMLNWNSDVLTVRWSKYPGCSAHWELKEQLYLQAVKHLERGLMWEDALRVCKELVTQYEVETFDYPKLADLLTSMAGLYRKIMFEVRPTPEYFRVSFYGLGFPAIRQNKTFVYRGKGFERLPEFQARILDQFPNAKLMTSLQPPTDEEKSQPVQLLQINHVTPIMEDHDRFKPHVHQKILSHFKVNEVNKFFFSRPYSKSKSKDNEFASLWVDKTVMQTKESFPGILQWYPIHGAPEVFTLCPLDNAIEGMRKTNDDLRNLILEHQSEDHSLNPLSMRLHGIIDAAVMGGTANYEKAFFTDRYLNENPDHEMKIIALQNMIADQIPLLSVGLRVHDEKKTEDLKPTHDRLVEMFKKMRTQVEEKYGTRTCDLELKRVPSTVVESAAANRQSNSSGSNSFSSNEGLKRNDHLNVSDNSGTRTSVNSHFSVDSVTSLGSRSRVLSSVIGITRRKSSAKRLENENDAVPKITVNHHRTLNSQTSLHTPKVNPGGGQEFNWTPEEPKTTSVVVVSNRANGSTGSRPSSGHFVLTTSTPNHSRSPSMTSNRDSMISCDEAGGPGLGPPPPVPPKHCKPDASFENLSIASFDETDGVHKLYPKKRPPPPPPTNQAAVEVKTPPTPPKKPPFKPPID